MSNAPYLFFFESVCLKATKVPQSLRLCSVYMCYFYLQSAFTCTRKESRHSLQILSPPRKSTMPCRELPSPTMNQDTFRRKNAAAVDHIFFFFPLCGRLRAFHQAALCVLSETLISCHCACIADWRLRHPVLTCNALASANDCTSALRHLRTTVWAIVGLPVTMRRCFSCCWGLNSLNLASKFAPVYLSASTQRTQPYVSTSNGFPFSQRKIQ